MKEMVNIIPVGSCPTCGHKSFVVSEIQYDEYLTNADGEIVDSLEIEHSAAGMCLNCNKVFKMHPTREGFIPLTRLREIMLDHISHSEFVKLDPINDIPNPMEVNTNVS